VVAALLGVSNAAGRSILLLWEVPLALASYAVVTAGIALGISRAKSGFLRLPERGDNGLWLIVLEGVVASLVLLLGARTVLLFPLVGERLSSPGAVLLLALASFLLLRAIPTWGRLLRHTIVALLALVGAAAAWAGPDPTDSSVWLVRNAWLFIALAAAAVVSLELGARSLVGEWRRSVQSVGGVAAAAALVVLGISQLQQVPVFDKASGHTPLQFAPVLATLVAIPALMVLCIRLALRIERDPLRLPELGRTAYVYVAELLLVLLFVHIRFNVPEIFLGTMVRYWTFAVMVLAFVGNVLAVPLRKTGVLLPLIPLVAFWVKPPPALMEFADHQAPGLSPFLAYLEKLPQHFDAYAWLWTLAGGVYGLVALSRKSFGWALLAALASNAALWALLTHQGVPFLIHPQAWVIPLALIILVSEHVNRRRLDKDLSNSLRYFGVAMIYVASAADMFIAGVGNSVWLPVLLAVFCVAGVLLGILLRVRAFLFLGVAFLLLDVFAMIWHAAVDLEQTWVWYVSGIILGVAILTLFAVFEKRKKRHAEAVVSEETPGRPG
jgi:hypothetical protein